MMVEMIQNIEIREVPRTKYKKKAAAIKEMVEIYDPQMLYVTRLCAKS